MSDALAAYVAAVQSLPRVSAAEAEDLQARARAGDTRAYDALWQQSLRLVLAAARRLAAKGAPFELDMIQEGNIAAGAALQTWDPERGALSTWIMPKVRGAMIDYSLKDRRRGTGSKSAPEPFMRSLDDDAGVIDDYAESDLPGSEAPDSATAADAVDLGAYVLPEDAYARVEKTARLRALLPDDAASRQVLEMRYGLDGEGGKSDKEISDLLGVSRTTIHRLMQSGLQHMRHKSETFGET